MLIALTAATTPAQAIKMAYEFASALRATGWSPEDIGHARALWIGGEYAASPLLEHAPPAADIKPLLVTHIGV